MPMSITWQNVRISALLGATAFILLAYAASRPFIDFAVYWTAAHLFATHQNAYSIPQVFEAQRTLGWRGNVPLMFMSPPWMLPVIAPLGYMRSYITSWLLWIAVLTACAAISSRMLMDMYFGALEIPEISHPRSYRYLFAFTFYPVLLS